MVFPGARGHSRIGPSRYEHNDQKRAQGRKETRQMVADLERNFSPPPKPIDRSVDRSLPRPLATRTVRCLEHGRRRPSCIGAATAGDSGNMSPTPEQRPVELQVTIEPKSKPRPVPERVENWMGHFLRMSSPRKRVQWRSRLYGEEPAHRGGEVPASERAEVLLDAGADEFVRWLNTLGAERSSLTKDIVRQLFSVGGGGSADETSRALNIAPREIRAVPETVASDWNRPELALENRMAYVSVRDRKGQSSPRAAFGRPERRWSPANTDDDDDGDSAQVERPDVPEDLISLKRLFRDIWHLRSVKYLVHYLSERPELPRPRFLEEKGLFERRDASEPVPFYRQVLSQKSVAECMGK